VTVLSDGRILVTYVSIANENGATSLLGRFMGADGTMAVGEVNFGTASGGWIYAPEVTALGDGEALAVWFASGPRIEDPEGGNPTFGPGAVRARVIGSDGQPRGDDFVVNSTSLDFPYAKPAVTTLTDGRVLVVWHSGDSADGDWGTLRGRVIGADGALIETDFVINSTPINNQSTPSVAALADGRVLISWTSDDGVTTGPVTRAVYITPDVGTAGADRITGSAVQDIQMGLGGNDRLSGGGGDDQLMGGDGRDALSGGAGADSLDGGTGRDVLSGGAGADKLNGGTGNDVIDGGAGRDGLKGGEGADTLSGGSGRDWLKGGAGNDTITGGVGGDVLVGGAGADVFVFAAESGRDRVTDFGAGDMLQIDAGSWTGTAAQFVADHAAVTGEGVLITLSEGSSILLAGLTTTDGLADELQLI
jgi:Ca2+-binding RTX toxin-like protein